MLGRIIALAIALAVGSTGVLPTVDGARCLSMDKRITPGEDCCPMCQSPPVASIGKPCCETIHGRALEARAPVSVAQPRLAPAPLTAILAPPLPLVANEAALRSVAALPRGRPPGEQLDRFSAVIRI
jgi:hypothetical protein